MYLPHPEAKVKYLAQGHQQIDQCCLVDIHIVVATQVFETLDADRHFTRKWGYGSIYRNKDKSVLYNYISSEFSDSEILLFVLSAGYFQKNARIAKI